MSFDQPDGRSALQDDACCWLSSTRPRSTSSTRRLRRRRRPPARGISLETVFAENNAIAQIYQVFGRLHATRDERPTVIVAHPVAGDALERVGRNAVKEGRRLDRLEPACAVPGRAADAGAGPAREQRDAGQHRDRAAPGSSRSAPWCQRLAGLLIYVQGPPATSAAEDRLRGCQEVLGDRFDWKILHADWTEIGSEKAVVAFLRLKTHEAARPVVVVAQNDAMAIGARRAIVAMRPTWSETPFLGCDGLPSIGQRLVDEGALAGTVVMPSTAGRAIDLAAAWLDKGTQPPPSVMIEPWIYAPASLAAGRGGREARRAWSERLLAASRRPVPADVTESGAPHRPAVTFLACSVATS